MSQGVTLRGAPVIKGSARASKRPATATSLRGAHMPTRASFSSEGHTSEMDARLMSTIRAGGMVVPRQEAGDPFGLLLRERIVFLGSQVDDFTADAVISQLLLLDAQDPKKVSITFSSATRVMFAQRRNAPPNLKKRKSN
jgi:hypothetical protein